MDWQDARYAMEGRSMPELFYLEEGCSLADPNLSIGQNCSRASRPGQDPISSLKSPVRQVYRVMVRRRHSNEGHL